MRSLLLHSCKPTRVFLASIESSSTGKYTLPLFPLRNVLNYAATLVLGKAVRLIKQSGERAFEWSKLFQSLRSFMAHSQMRTIMTEMRKQRDGPPTGWPNALHFHVTEAGMKVKGESDDALAVACLYAYHMLLYCTKGTDYDPDDCEETW